MNRTLLGLALAFGAATCYGLSYVVAKLAYDAGTNALTVNVFRLALIALTHAAWVAASGARWRISWPALAGALGMGIFICIAGAGNLSAIAYIPVNLAILIFYTYPLMTLMMAAAIDRRWPHPVECAAVALSLLGLTLALEVSFSTLDPLGVGLASLGAFGAAAHLVAAQRSMNLADFRLVTLHMGLSGLVCAVLFASAASAFQFPGELTGWGFFTIVLVGFSAGMVLMLSAVRQVGPVRTAIVMSLEPPIVILAALLLLEESLEAVQLAGAALVVAGVMLAQRIRDR